MYNLDDMKSQLITEGGYTRHEVETMDAWQIVAEWLKLPLLVP